MGGGTDASWRCRKIRVITDSWVMTARRRRVPRRQNGQVAISRPETRPSSLAQGQDGGPRVPGCGSWWHGLGGIRTVWPSPRRWHGWPGLSCTPANSIASRQYCLYKSNRSKERREGALHQGRYKTDAVLERAHLA